MGLLDKAKKTLEGSPLTVGRDKLPLKSLDGKEATLVDFDITKMVSTKTGELQDVTIAIFREYPDNFVFGGLLMTKLVKSFDDEDIKELKEKGLVLRFERSETKGGNTITLITPIGLGA